VQEKGKQKKEEQRADSRTAKKELEECKRERDNFLAEWKRARADFINYKNEENERFKVILEGMRQNLILKLLPIVDSFEVAEKEIEKQQENDEGIKGLLQIKKQLLDFLKKEGVEEIESLGKKFDPSLHEVIEVVERKGRESGEIVEEIQKGYKFKGNVIRPAKVKVVK